MVKQVVPAQMTMIYFTHIQLKLPIEIKLASSVLYTVKFYEYMASVLNSDKTCFMSLNFVFAQIMQKCTFFRAEFETEL